MRSSAKQTGKSHNQPAEHGVHERGRVGADHELLVDTLLADLYVHALVQERLLIPEFPKSGGRLGFDASRKIQNLEIACGQIAAMNLQ